MKIAVYINHDNKIVMAFHKVECVISAGEARLVAVTLAQYADEAERRGREVLADKFEAYRENKR